MKLSLCNEVVRDLPFEEQCRLARDLGYDGLEVAPFTLGEQPHRLPDAKRREIRAQAERHDLVITGLHWLLITPEGLSITEPDPQVRTRTVDVMRGLIGLCADLGGRYLVHGSPRQRAVPTGETADDAQARAAEAFATVAKDAETAGVTYCIEPLAAGETALFNTVEQAARVVDAIGSPALRTMIDACAAAQSEALPLPELIDRWLPRGQIAHIHLNDPNRRAPGQGALRFGPILDALRRHSYQDWCGVEPFVYRPDGPTTAARAIGYLAGLLEQQAERAGRRPVLRPKGGRG